MKAKHGITLVKLLIVATVFGVLGAIAVPQFSSATGDAQVSSLQGAHLEASGKQIEPHEHPHDEALPVATCEGSADCARRMATETDSSGDADSDG